MLEKPKSRSPWVRAYDWLLSHPDAGSPGYDFLLRLATPRALKRRKVTFKPKNEPIPKRMLQKEQKQDLRKDCEALCKAIVWRRDCNNPPYALCISCRRMYACENLQWTHFIAQNDSKWLQYDTRNTGYGCSHCNGFMQGNYREYREAIERREPGLAFKLESEAVQYRTWKQDTYQLGETKKRLIAECDKNGIDWESVLRK